MSNSSGAVNKKCLAAMGEGEKWKCMFAQNAYAHTEVPTFLQNSALDAFQTWCILCATPVDGFPNQTSHANGNCSSAPGWRQCSQNPENCTSAQMGPMNQYISDFVGVVENTTTFHRPGNGAFIHSCHEHCEALAAAWFEFQIDGVSMKDAVPAWWFSDGTEPASKHSYTPCHYKTSSPHKCNLFQS